jgi:hypothetical protein
MFWPFTVWINCSNDFKNFVNSRPSASNFKTFSRSLEQFFLTVGQNNFDTQRPALYYLVIVLSCPQIGSLSSSTVNQRQGGQIKTNYGVFGCQDLYFLNFVTCKFNLILYFFLIFRLLLCYFLYPSICPRSPECIAQCQNFSRGKCFFAQKSQVFVYFLT